MMGMLVVGASGARSRGARRPREVRRSAVRPGRLNVGSVRYVRASIWAGPGWPLRGRLNRRVGLHWVWPRPGWAQPGRLQSGRAQRGRPQRGGLSRRAGLDGVCLNRRGFDGGTLHRVGQHRSGFGGRGFAGSGFHRVRLNRGSVNGTGLTGVGLHRVRYGSLLRVRSLPGPPRTGALSARSRPGGSTVGVSAAGCSTAAGAVGASSVDGACWLAVSMLPGTRPSRTASASVCSRPKAGRGASWPVRRR